jgi:Bacteriophage head to tail connecting protein
MLTLDNDSNEYKELFDNIGSERTARTALNNRWLELWSLYRTDPLKISTDEGWQSKLNDGKVFEIVETVASYIRSALFFSDNWVQLEATEPKLGEALPIVNAYFRNCLNSSNLRREFRIYLRQLLLLGFSAMAVEYRNKGLHFTTLNSYDLYIESSRRYDSNSYSFRDTYLNEASFFEYVDSGLIDTGNMSAEEFFDHYRTGFTTEQAQFRSLSDTTDTIHNEHIVLTEYWCPIEKELYRIVGTTCVGEESLSNCPWLISTIYELPDTAYGLGLLDSSIGLIVENNCIMNRRLDNMAVSIDNMWLFVDDGVTNPDDIRTSPGKVLSVSRPDVLTPLYPPPNNFTVTYQEAQVIDSKIDRNTGTGALVSSGAYRSGERVTAEEINAVKEAGGNRLTDIYEHIEDTFVVPLLKVCLGLLRDNKRQAVVKLPSNKSGIYDYFKMLPSDLSHDYTITVEASQSVINRDRNIRRLQEFLALVASVPQFAELVDYNNLYSDLLHKFGFDHPDRYIKAAKEEEPAPTAAPTSPLQALTEQAGAIGGATSANAITQAAAGGELANAIAGMTGNPQAAAEDPALAQQQMLAMTQPM